MAKIGWVGEIPTYQDKYSTQLFRFGAGILNRKVFNLVVLTALLAWVEGDREVMFSILL